MVRGLRAVAMGARVGVLRVPILRRGLGARCPGSDGAYRATVCSWVRVWHPTDAALRDSVPYVVVLVELAAAGGIKMIGNLLGDQRADVVVGMPVQASFEHHERYSLVHWERI